jgi:hypothetical protein
VATLPSRVRPAVQHLQRQKQEQQQAIALSALGAEHHEIVFNVQECRTQS